MKKTQHSLNSKKLPEQVSGSEKARNSTSKHDSSSSSSKDKRSSTSSISKKVPANGQKSVTQKLEDAKSQLTIKKVGGVYAPEGYRMRVIQPAKNADVVSLARAMNEDFSPKMKALFETETAAAVAAQQTGIYIGWRCPEFKHDCQRVFETSRCFCDHPLKDHASYDSLSVKVPCRVPGCTCKEYKWIPNRPEDIGEFWLPKRPGFDAEAWRAKCKCKHTHNFHDTARPHRCKIKACSCSGFYSDFLCAACDRHWEDHQTFFDSEQSRREQGLPVGTEWLPFAELPELRNIALTGDETDDSRYLELRDFDPIPSNAVTGNNMPVQVKGRGKSAFKPVYD